MSQAQHSPGRPRQSSGNELATSNSTANRFLGTAQRSWMTSDGSSPSPALPRKPPASTSKPRVLSLPSRPPAIPPPPAFIAAESQPDPKTKGGPLLDSAKRHVMEPIKTLVTMAPMSPITPETKFADSSGHKQMEPAHVEPPHRLPVLPSPEPSNGSHPSPAAISEASHQTGAAPAASTLPDTASVAGEEAAPVVPAASQPNPASTRPSQSPSVNVSSLSIASLVQHATPTSSYPPSKIDSMWKNARNRLKIMQERAAAHNNLSETVELPRLRILEDACLANDMFYLALHQVYCTSSFAPSQLPSLRSFGIQPEVGFNVIKQLLVDNQRLSGDFLKWCVSYPSPLMSMLELEEYRAALSQVADCLSKLSQNWLVYEKDLRARAYPPQIGELVVRLGVISPALQSIIFTALSRRLFGPREQLLKECTLLFEEDKAKYRANNGRIEHDALQESFKYRRLCASHGVDPNHHDNHDNSNMQKNTTTASIPTPVPAQSPASTTAPQPIPTLPQGPSPYHQGQYAPSVPPYHEPPTSHYARPGSGPPFVGTLPISTPPNPHVQKFSYPPHPSSLVSTSTQNNPQPQAGSQARPAAPSRQDSRQSSTFATPTNSVPPLQMPPAGRDNRSLSGRPPGQTRVNRPPSTAAPVNVSTNSPSAHTLPLPYAYPVSYNSPYPMAQNFPSAAYGQPSLQNMSQSSTVHMMPMAMPSQLTSRDPKQQPQQAPFSPHPTLPAAMLGPSPPMAQNNSLPFQPGIDANKPPALVYYFSAFAMPAKKLLPNQSVFKSFFHVSRETLEKRPRLVSQGGSSVLTPVLSDGDVSYRLRCVRYDGQLGIDSLPAWTRAENAWPEVVYIHVNKTEVHRPRNSKNMPLDINRMLEPGVNEVQLNIIHNTQQRAKPVTYAIAVEVLRFANVTSFKNLVQQLPSQDSLQQVQSRLGVNNNDDDLMIMDNFISIDLRDPFTTRIFDIPIRGAGCTHRECFDLSTFLQTITFTPPAFGKRSPYLRCPICRKDILPHHLLVDEFLLEVRATLTQQQQSETAKCIRVKSDGSWEAVLETDDDNKTPSKKLKRDRASFEADLFKTEESRENSLSRIPEAPEVIELD